MSRKADGDGQAASVLAAGKTSFTTMLREAANYRELARTPYGLKPILVFTLIAIVAAVDGRITSVALPEIVRDLDLEISTVIAAQALIGFVVIFFVLFFAHLMDRVPRVPFVGIGAIVSGIFSLVTTRTRTEWEFTGARGADGIGDAVTGVPRNVLIPDYYPVHVRGRAYALAGVTARVLQVAAPLVLFFIFAAGHSWRVPFTITGPLLIVVGIVGMLALKEPVRGYMERRAVGMPEEEALVPEEPVSFGESIRTFWAIRTWRRLFIADVPGSVSDWAFGFFFALFMFQFYGFQSRDLALLGFAVGLVALPFGFMAGGMVDVLIRRRPQRVLVFTGVLTVLGSFAIAGISARPPLWIIVGLFIVFGCAGALLGPARAVLYAQISPAHIRGIALNATVLAGIPATIIRFLVATWVVDNYGNQGGLFMAVPFLLVAGLIEISAAGSFERDMRSSLSSQVAAQAWRRAQESGQARLLVCRDVDVEYDGIQVLFGADLDVGQGEIVAVLGTNGAGKSTLLKAIAGIQEASGGAIVFDGRDITHMPPHEVAGHGVVLMPGGRGVFPDLTVTENLAVANWLNDPKVGREKVSEVLGMFPVLRDRSNERAQLLSGGEQQMLSLSMAFLSKPRLLMIDELSLGLAPGIVEQLIETVHKINEQGTTVIVVEQSVNVALNVAERAIFMEKGEVKFVGKTADLLRRPDILRAVYVRGTAAAGGARPSTRKGEKKRRRDALEDARVVLEVKETSRAFGGVVAVDDVSLMLREGESLGLIGPNGAGKTTLFDIISGYQRPDHGKVFLEGTEISDLAAEERARRGLVRRFQDARLFPSLTVYENVLAALDQQLEVKSTVLTALQLPQVRQAERRIRRRADRLVDLLELGAYRDKFARELSTGLRRITDLACVLAAEPKVLMLDEPSTGIAQAEVESLVPLLRRVRVETGCSMLIIEHDMSLIAALSDELMAMDQGKTVIRGLPDEVLSDDRVIRSYLGTSKDLIKRSGVKT